MNAIILAGGKGSRLMPWHAPKCLLPIRGVPILHRIMTHLTDNGDDVVDSVIVCAGYRSDDILECIHAQGWDPTFLKVSDAGEGAPMGQRLFTARERADSERTLILYGDELADVDIRRLVRHHEGAALTFAAALTSVPGGQVVYHPQAPKSQRVQIIENATRWVNIGFAVVEPRCWELLRQEDGLSDWINRVAEQDEVRVYEHGGKRATVNSLQDLEYAEETWK